MKPATDIDISAKHVARLRGGEVGPLSRLATRVAKERADQFPFTEDDRRLLEEVLADEAAAAEPAA